MIIVHTLSFTRSYKDTLKKRLLIVISTFIEIVCMCCLHINLTDLCMLGRCVMQNLQYLQNVFHFC